MTELGTLRRVGVVYSPSYQASNLPIPGHKKGHLAYELMAALGFPAKIRTYQAPVAAKSHLLEYHEEDYIDFLFKTGDQFNEDHEQQLDEEERERREEFGLNHDCPPFKNMKEAALKLAGGSLAATKLVMEESEDVAFHWAGGRHHAGKDAASGYCYINDVVLCISKLLLKHTRILYLDTDIHHGDGVIDAFLFSNQVLCVDIHKYVQGFFPGTGSLLDIGKGIGKYYTVNAPLLDGVTDLQYLKLFMTIMESVKKWKPEAIVWTCGSDLLAGDPLGGFNLSLASTCFMARYIAEMNIPTVVFGGGGYHPTNAARMAALVTYQFLQPTTKQDQTLITTETNANTDTSTKSLERLTEKTDAEDPISKYALGLPKTIPTHIFSSQYKTDSLFTIPQPHVNNANSDEYLEHVLMTVKTNLKKIANDDSDSDSYESESEDIDKGSEEGSQSESQSDSEGSNSISDSG